MGQKAYVSLYTLLQTQHIRVGKNRNMTIATEVQNFAKSVPWGPGNSIGANPRPGEQNFAKSVPWGPGNSICAGGWWVGVLVCWLVGWWVGWWAGGEGRLNQ